MNASAGSGSAKLWSHEIDNLPQSLLKPSNLGGLSIIIMVAYVRGRILAIRTHRETMTLTSS